MRHWHAVLAPVSVPIPPRRPFDRLASLRLVVAWCLATVVLGGVFFAPPTSAEQPDRVAEAVLSDGVFVAPGRRSEVDREALVAVINEASRDGVEMGIVLAREPLPDNKAFALRVRQAADVDAVLSFDRDGTVHADTGEDYSGSEVRALTAARSVDGTMDEVALEFLRELVNEPETSTPALVSTIVRFVVYLVMALGVAVILEHLYRGFKRRREAALAEQPAKEQANSSSS